jgi:RND family efflux transporter MFP subunit
MKEIRVSVIVVCSALLCACLHASGAEEADKDGRVITGILLPRRDLVLKSGLTTRVEEILVAEGDHVKKGQVLIRLDITDAAMKVSLAQIDLEREEVEYSRVLGEYERVKGMRDRGSSSQAEYEKAHRDLRLAELAVKEGKLNLERAMRIRESGIIHAPFDGIVARLEKDTEDEMSEGEELIRIIDTGELRLEMLLPADQHGKVKLGMDMEIKVVSTGEEFSTRVETIVPVPEGGGGFMITSRVSNRGYRLLPGTRVTWHVKTD